MYFENKLQCKHHMHQKVLRMCMRLSNSPVFSMPFYGFFQHNYVIMDQYIMGQWPVVCLPWLHWSVANAVVGHYPWRGRVYYVAENLRFGLSVVCSWFLSSIDNLPFYVTWIRDALLCYLDKGLSQMFNTFHRKNIIYFSRFSQEFTHFLILWCQSQGSFLTICDVAF